MKYKLVSVRDSKSELFDMINMYKTTQEAIRAFGVNCNDPKSNFFKFAEDYSLFELGEYDDQTGIIQILPSPVLVITAPLCSREHIEYYAAMKLVDNMA